MEKRRDKLSGKSIEILKDLEKWAKETQLLALGEQIEFSLRIVPVPIVAQKQEPKALSMTIRELLDKKRCDSLGISKQSQGVLRGHLCRGLISFEWGSGHLADAKPIPVKTVADLIKLSGDDLLCIRNFGEKGVENLQKILKSIGINWE